MTFDRNDLERRIIRTIALTGFTLCFAIPLVWLIIAAFDKSPRLSLHFPEVSLANFASVLRDESVLRSFTNGLFLSVGQSMLVMITSSLAAYWLSRTSWRLRRVFMYCMLIGSSLPVTVVMVSVYQQFILMRLIDSLLGTMLFLASTSLPYAIWMVKSFVDSVPRELEEAAWIDGATVLKGLQQVVVPIMLPGVFAAGVFTFVQSWGNFFVPYILLQSPNKLPPAVTLYQFFGQYGMVDYGRLAAFCILYTVPAIVFYLLGQRYIQAGLRAGGVKG